MSVENEVANLTTSVDNLTEAVNVKKQTLDATVADSEAARDQSQTARDTALTYRDQSLSHANDALAYSQDAASAVAYQDLTSIAESKSESAVDVFVYDTSRDSDGGAWRHRCQHTSWYNEPLNTSTRGARREFPAVAVIVAESDKVTIYDGDDPALPMWRVLDYAGEGLNRTHAYNGMLAVGSDAGLYVEDFAGDALTGATPTYTTSTDPALFNGDVKQVTIYPLPDAPIVEQTGLPAPTFVIGDGGDTRGECALTVFLNGQQAVYSDNKNRQTGHVANEQGVWWSINGKRDLLFAPWTDIRSGSGFGDKYTSDLQSLPARPENFQDMRHTLAFGGDGAGNPNPNLREDGVQLTAVDYSDISRSMVAFFDTKRATGWMNGDIKGAFLSDTDDTDLVGEGELVVNGDFSSTDISHLRPTSGAILSVVDGQLNVDRNGSNNYGFTFVVSTTIGKRYVLSLDWLNGYSSALRVAYIDGDVPDPGASGGNRIIPNPVQGEKLFGSFVAQGTTTTIHIRSEQNVSSSYIFDNISLTAADTDRSANAKDLTVNGTVTREPVAPGADLVAYSGFSPSNYLEQPYNPDLDFGTGDFCFMGWVRLNASNYTRVYAKMGEFQIDQRGAGGEAKITTAGNGYINYSVPDGEWALLTVLRRNGAFMTYVNGRFQDVRDDDKTNGVDINPNDEPLRIGFPGLERSGLGGSLALIRISATAPTAEQIKKIYEDEKVLFQENAQATLYGSSDEVTALAHDEVTDLLHVGTSDGRSVFQGLRRVDNTTDPVNTAISAHNGMIAEE